MTYWDTQAKEDIPEREVTLRDYNQRELELAFIFKWLNPKDFLVEVGCGNGYSTRSFSKRVETILSLDFSEEMIHRAAKVNKDLANVVFTTGDVKNIRLDSDVADVVVSQRCLINLMTWQDQICAINEIYRILKPGGLLVLVEGLQLDDLNKIRIKVGLPEIAVVPHNNNFNSKNLIRHLMTKFDVLEVRTFGVYDFITRIIHPLVTYPNEPTYDATINAVAKKIELELVGKPEFLSMCAILDFSKFSRIIGVAARKPTRAGK